MIGVFFVQKHIYVIFPCHVLQYTLTNDVFVSETICAHIIFAGHEFNNITNVLVQTIYTHNTYIILSW